MLSERAIKRKESGFPRGAEHFAYKNGSMTVENVSIAEIALQVGTPFYVYSATAIRENYRRFANAFADMPILIAYALKANSNQAVLKLLAKEGAGADIVSAGELERAKTAGITPDKIVYSGVGKTIAELDFALGENIRCFNVESVAELRLLAERAAALGRVARISLRINPDIDAQTHAKISTGKAENKFGIPAVKAHEVYALAAALKSIKICGVDVHIGSQIEKAEPFAKAFAYAAKLVTDLRAAGFPIRHIDIGGGLGIAYRSGQIPLEPDAYAACVRHHLGGLDLEFITEPGRYIVGNAGALIASVLTVKQSADKNFLITDAGMNDLIRPTLYDAWHEILPVEETFQAEEKFKTDIVGPVCETGDYLALERAMPLLPGGALLAVLSSGAYGAVMSGTYNSRPLIPEVLVEDNRFALIRPRQSITDLIEREIIPVWV